MKKVFSFLLALTLTFTLVGCGDKAPGSIEEGRIIINGASYTFNTDTYDDIETKCNDGFDKVHGTSDAILAQNAADAEDNSSVFFVTDDAQLLSSISITEGSAGRFDFSFDGITEKSSFLDVLDCFGLLVDGEYIPTDTYENGHMWSEHSTDTVSYSVDWNGDNTGCITYFDKQTYIQIVINFHGESMDTKKAISSMHIYY